MKRIFLQLFISILLISSGFLNLNAAVSQRNSRLSDSETILSWEKPFCTEISISKDSRITQVQKGKTKVFSYLFILVPVQNLEFFQHITNHFKIKKIGSREPFKNKFLKTLMHALSLP